MGQSTEIINLLLVLAQRKLLGLSFKGMNTRNTLMTVHLKSQTGDYKAGRMHIILSAEQILELGDTGSMVYD